MQLPKFGTGSPHISKFPLTLTSFHEKNNHQPTETYEKFFTNFHIFSYH